MLYFVGDIHGDYDGLMAAMEAVNFNKEEDKLVCSGDLIDRGDQNKEVVALIKEPWFIPTRGNHDQFAIDSVLDPLFDQYMHMFNGGTWFYMLSPSEQEDIAARLAELPIVMEVEYEGKVFGVVHAEVPFLFERWQHFVDHINGNYNWAIEIALWGRNVFMSPESAPILTDIDYVIHGHNSIPQPQMIRNRVWLDTKDFGAPIVLVSAQDIIDGKLAGGRNGDSME